MTVPTAKPPAGIALTFPTIQNWSCNSCSVCCRQYGIDVTEEERQRILSLQWKPEDGAPTRDAMFVWHAGPAWNKRYRLGFHADGACVFLNERGLCRIHARFGEAAKPRACRAYPFAFHPAGEKVTISLRFTCPSVLANRGLSMRQQRDQLKSVARAIVPAGHEQIPAPVLSRFRRLEWSEFLRIVAALDKLLSPANVPIALKLQRALFWLNLLAKAPSEQLSGSQAARFLDFIEQAACENLPKENSPSQPHEPPSAIAITMFHQLTAQYARKDTAAELTSGWRGRWKLLRAATRFARGTGMVPSLQPVFREVPFESIEQLFGFPEECEELWTRYFRVKVQGLHFCGLPCYGMPLIEGFQTLALIFPATMWIARWLAASQDRTQLTAGDVSQALAISDNHHGYSPLFGSFSFRRRVQILSHRGEIPKLIRWYAR